MKNVLHYVMFRYPREFREAMDLVANFTWWYDTERYLCNKSNGTVEEAFRNSIVKWTFVSVMECMELNDDAYRIGSAWTTCGLCLHFECRCEECPLKDDGVVCCREYSDWVKGSVSGKEVLRRIVEEYERWKGENKVQELQEYIGGY